MNTHSTVHDGDAGTDLNLIAQKVTVRQKHVTILGHIILKKNRLTTKHIDCDESAQYH